MRIFQISILILVIILAGCSTISKYDDQEIAAIVKGQTITVGELRFLYPDDAALDYLEWTIEVELVKQEVKEMGLDITDKLSDEADWFAELPPKDTKDEGGKQIRKFAKAQAKKLDMDPEEYQQEYARRIKEQNAYLVTYLEEMAGEIDVDDEKQMEELNEKSIVLLDELKKRYENEIEVFIE